MANKQREVLAGILNNLEIREQMGLPVKEDAQMAIDYLNSTYGERGNELLWAKIVKLAYRLVRQAA